ncbi:hypothetical protein [Stenotrophomonas oahuensis]|uniref:Uncharacterized protein n=1 Tax=Stenotrophomonas oahuensis TaxID=3003271 RepID=A0ABY9YQJ1_9GAMM|nr:hypothetical protein [Stenotrophomonas sp. A5586]WNH52953.1 hypothetical protein PDM29_01405 [Stenotrophomonas sp. A5586]
MFRVASSVPNAPLRPVVPDPINLEQMVRSLDLADLRNVPEPSFTYCQLSTAAGPHGREAIGHAISICYDVIAAARQGAPRHRLKALNQTLLWLGPKNSQRLGNIALRYIFVLGAVHAGLTAMIRSEPDNHDAVRCRRSLEQTITKVGSKSGYCRSAPTGCWDAEKATLKFSRTLDIASDEIIKCVSKVDAQKLIDGMAGVLLTRPLLDHVRERYSSEASASDPLAGKGLELLDVLDRQALYETECVIRRMIEMSTYHHWETGLRELMLVPDFVINVNAVRH